VDNLKVLNKIKNRILRSSNQYNFYKTNYEKLLIENTQIKESLEKYEEILDNQNTFNTKIEKLCGIADKENKNIEHLLDIFSECNENIEQLSEITLDSNKKVEQLSDITDESSKRIDKLSNITDDSNRTMENLCNLTNEEKKKIENLDVTLHDSFNNTLKHTINDKFENQTKEIVDLINKQNDTVNDINNINNIYLELNKLKRQTELFQLEYMKNNDIKESDFMELKNSFDELEKSINLMNNIIYENHDLKSYIKKVLEDS